MRALVILVVEDNALIAMLLTDMLTGLGHIVCESVATHAAAVAAAARHRPDLMIVDARLGADSGVAAMEEILAAGPQPHIYTSGMHMRKGRPGSVTLQKPYSEAMLVEAIAAACGGYGRSIQDRWPPLPAPVSTNTACPPNLPGRT